MRRLFECLYVHNIVTVIFRKTFISIGILENLDSNFGRPKAADHTCQILGEIADQKGYCRSHLLEKGVAFLKKGVCPFARVKIATISE